MEPLAVSSSYGEKKQLISFVWERLVTPGCYQLGWKWKLLLVPATPKTGFWRPAREKGSHIRGANAPVEGARWRAYLGSRPERIDLLQDAFEHTRGLKHEHFIKHLWNSGSQFGFLLRTRPSDGCGPMANRLGWDPFYSARWPRSSRLHFCSLVTGLDLLCLVALHSDGRHLLSFYSSSDLLCIS